MNDAPNNSSGDIKMDDWLNPGEQNVKLIYFLYFAGILVGITSIVGAVLAFMNKDKASDLARSHYIFQFRTFVGMFIAAVAAVLIIFILFRIFSLLGGFGVLLINIFSILLWPILIAAVVWYIIRCVKGFQALSKKEAIADPNTLLF